ncbi:MAG: energy-coupling factor ABC transporter permease [Actinobacteria bacterium]|nr:energy-coupling factor ABC transporter permease [Actinomycetota bacterium]MCL6088414.1 energy-coupling factor ABC transporter permease [Actinomycetota bacterium]
MHIPDGFIDIKTAAVTGVFSLSGLIVAVIKVKKFFRAKVVAVMGVFAALIFAAQMINFTVLGGTSGHLLGAALACIVLGPYAGGVIITIVLIVQAFAFGDGGITALGANVFNMAVVGVVSAYLIYKLFTKLSKKRIVFYTAVAAGSWFSVVIASAFCSLELAASGTYSLGITLGSMVPVHMVIGVGEAIITTIIIAFIDKVRPDIILTRNWDIGSSVPEIKAENK